MIDATAYFLDQGWFRVVRSLLTPFH
jgi:hypothetical protein